MEIIVIAKDFNGHIGSNPGDYDGQHVWKLRLWSFEQERGKDS